MKNQDNSQEVMYSIVGIGGTPDYLNTLRILTKQVGEFTSKYHRGPGIMFFSTGTEINASELNRILLEDGKVLKTKGQDGWGRV